MQRRTYQQHSSKKDSRRRRTKQQAAAHHNAEQLVMHQPQWREVASAEHVASQMNDSPVPWQLTHLEEMEVPAFSYTPND